MRKPTIETHPVILKYRTGTTWHVLWERSVMGALQYVHVLMLHLEKPTHIELIVHENGERTDYYITRDGMPHYKDAVRWKRGGVNVEPRLPDGHR